MSKYELREKIAQRHPEFQEKGSLINYYMNFEFPDRQKKMAEWWQKVLRDYLILSKKLTLDLSQVEEVFAIHNLKPLPLKNLLQYYIQHNTMNWVDPKEMPKNNDWWSKVSGIIWKVQSEEMIAENPHKRVYIVQLMDQKQKHLKGLLPFIFDQRTVINEEDFLNRISAELSLSEDINLLVRRLINDSVIRLATVQTKNNVLMYHKDKKKLFSDAWCSTQKAKFLLNEKIEYFQHKIEERCAKADNLLKKAKELVAKGDKRSAKNVLQNYKAYETSLNNFTLRREALIKTLTQIEFNEMNNQSIDALKVGQDVIKETMADLDKVQQILDRDKEIKADQKLINEKLDGMVSEDQQEEIQKMMHQLEGQVSRTRMKMEDRKVRPQVPADNKKLDIETQKNMKKKDMAFS